MKTTLKIFFILFYSCLLFANEEKLETLNVRVNHLGDAEAYYITQTTWIPDKPDSLITIYFNSDEKTFWRYVINEYNPVNDVYTTLFEEQENKSFFIKLFYYYKGNMEFLKKFINNPMDTKDYVVLYDMHNKKRTVKLFKDEKNKYRKNMLGQDTKGRLVNCNKTGYLKQSDNKILFVSETKNKKIKEDFLFEDALEFFIISETNLVVFKKQGEYFIYDIDLKKIERARKLSNDITEKVQIYIDEHTTTTIEKRFYID